jgi:arylformamidase
MKNSAALLVTVFSALFLSAPAHSQTAALSPATLKVQRDIPYTEPADPRQKVDVYAPEGAQDLPVVFWIHGGGWQAGDRTDVQLKPQAFADKGFVFVSTGYRLLPAVDMVTIFRDVAKSIRWVHEHISQFGGDPQRILVMGHSAGAQLAALMCIDDRYLKAEGLSLSIIKGCVPVDGDTFDVPAIIETAEHRLRVHGLPMPKLGHRLKFGNDPAKHRDYSAVTHVARDKRIPPFLIIHVAEHPDTNAQAQRLEIALKGAGIPVKRFAAKETTHSRVNENLGVPEDPTTHALFEFVTEVLAGGGNASAGPRPYLGKIHNIPGTIELEDFDEGGEGVAYHDLDPENQEKKEPPYRKSGVDLEWREAASGKFNLGWTRPGEWLLYTVDVREAGTYRIDMHVACKDAGGTFHLEFNGVDRTGPITVPDTGGWEHLKPFSHEGVKLNAGPQVMKVVMATAGKSGSIGDIDYLKFVKQ